ncbi:NUDIX domain-containing protein [Planctomycetaceae bacterium]|nr:NUDIX domain-containing protein [bacterium]MDC0274535.1 NUDIX domain-containing protein [Planctomycetaceae bacterium]
MTGREGVVMIGVAVVQHGGRYLVGVRSEDRTLSGKTEFPGGKCEPHESPMTCAVRECREEAGIEVEPVMLLGEREFEYDHDVVDIRFWLCKPKVDLDLDADYKGFKWLTAGELLKQRFPEANETLLEKIRLEGPFFDRCV